MSKADLRESKKLIKLSNGITKEMSGNEAYEQFEKFLYKIAYTWSKQYEFDDIFQLAGMGLTKAYNSYSADKGILFMTYLATVVNNEILMYHRKNKKHFYVKSLDYSLTTDKDGNSMSLMDVIPDNTNYEEIAVTNINKLEINNLLDCLNSKEKSTIQGLFIDGISQKKLGEKLNVSQSWISRTKFYALNKLKKIYEEGEVVLNSNVKKECFQYFSENDTKERPELITDAAKKYGCTEGTAENYYYTWRTQYMVKKLPPKEEGNTTISKNAESNKSACEKVKRFKPKNGILQATDLRGKIMCYSLYDNGNGFNIKRPNGNTVMPIEFEEVNDLIKELQEICRVGE